MGTSTAHLPNIHSRLKLPSQLHVVKGVQSRKRKSPPVLIICGSGSRFHLLTRRVLVIPAGLDPSLQMWIWTFNWWVEQRLKETFGNRIEVSHRTSTINRTKWILDRQAHLSFEDEDASQNNGQYKNESMYEQNETHFPSINLAIYIGTIRPYKCMTAIFKPLQQPRIPKAEENSQNGIYIYPSKGKVRKVQTKHHIIHQHHDLKMRSDRPGCSINPINLPAYELQRKRKKNEIPDMFFSFFLSFIVSSLLQSPPHPSTSPSPTSITPSKSTNSHH